MRVRGRVKEEAHWAYRDFARAARGNGLSATNRASKYLNAKSRSVRTGKSDEN
jgi:hypothetical protein